MSPSQKPLRIPETMTPVDIGAYMVGLREHFKLSLQDVSERLHIRVRYVQAIEQGQTEQLPGPVYARGYIHTYAEFLGLDADQVAAQWFASPQASAATAPAAATLAPPTPQPRLKPVGRSAGRHWRGLGVAGVAAVAVLLLVSQMFGGEKEAVPEAPTVAPVPEDLLASVRNLVMPTPQNIDCLMNTQWLTCFYADNVTRAMTNAEHVDQVLLVGDMDLSQATIAVEQPKPEEEAAEEEKSEDKTANKEEKETKKADKSDKAVDVKEEKKETAKEDKKEPVKEDKKTDKPAEKKEDKKPDEKHD